MRPCAAPCAIFPSGANGGPKTSAEAQRSGFGGKWRSYILPSGQPDGHTCPQWGQETRPRCPARKLSFLRWGKHSAWLSAPHFAAPGGGFAGRSPHPLPRRKVRSAQNSYGKRKGDQETKEHRKRDVTLTIRVTQAEKDAIIVNAMHAGKDLTDYILSVNDRAIISPPPDLSPLLRELKRIGTNINQVAAKVNSGVSYVPGLREVAEQQAEIIRWLRALTEDRTWQP